MKTLIPWLGFVVAVAGCTPKTGDAGVLDTGNDSDSDGGSGITGDDGGTSVGSASASGTSGMTSVGTSGMTSGGSDGMTSIGSDGGTTGGVPAACVELGWLDSYEAFTEMAGAAGNTYWYVSEDGGDSGFEIFCNYRTTIVVEDGQVVRREFENLGPPDNHPDLECTDESFVEEGADVGTTDDIAWARPAWTLEELYQGCCEEALTQPTDENNLIFSVDRAGIMASCSYFPQNCADGCAEGPVGYGSISIDAVTFGPWSPG